MKRYLDKRNNFGTIWSARTHHFTIKLRLTQTFERYDGEDADGATQAALDKGVFVMFDSELTVEFNGVVIGCDQLGASCYREGETFRFVWDGYFRDMLANAIAEAREHFADMPRMRGAPLIKPLRDGLEKVMQAESDWDEQAADSVCDEQWKQGYSEALGECASIARQALA